MERACEPQFLYPQQLDLLSLEIAHKLLCAHARTRVASNVGKQQN
jgi:hypothetical protein